MEKAALLRVAVVLVGFAAASACGGDAPPTPTAPTDTPAVSPGQPSPAPAPAPVPSGRRGIWISQEELLRLPETGPSWQALDAAAGRSCGRPILSDQNDSANVCVLAKALVFARTGSEARRGEVADALRAITSQTYRGRALSLGRELAAYVIAADLIDLPAYDPPLDSTFRSAITRLLTTRTSGGPDNLVECNESRPNNWGTHCGASRAAVAAYLGDLAQLDRTATVFKGWLGDRAAYSGFSYGELSWQCDPNRPVGINPPGCTRQGYSIDGVLPDDQRRAGAFRWPPPKENYVYEALQGALVQAVILQRAGYDAFAWQDSALLRAFRWLNQLAFFPAVGDDGWEVPLINAYYGTSFSAPVPSRPGKNMGYTDYTHAR
jgi:hypothetical protein